MTKDRTAGAGLQRRAFLVGLFALPTLSSAAPAATPVKTPSAIEGPYYPKPHMRLSDTDTDLVAIRGSGLIAKGDILHLRGQILEGGRKPARGARIEIWQCDANGRYIHPDDDSGFLDRDPGFQGFGKMRIGADGVFSFRTIKPVAYPGRTPHIHARIFYKGEQLTTQLYVAGDERNDRDTFYRRLSAEQKQAVSLVLAQASDGYSATIVLNV